MAYDPKYDALLRAIQYGAPKEAISFFKKKIYDVNTEVPYIFEDRKRYVVTPLYWAVRHNRLEICIYLLRNGAKPYSHLVFELYPLHDACNRGYHGIVQAFIDAKVDVDRVTEDFDTPLHIACMRGHIEVVHRLLRAGANCNAVNNAGRTPLQEASYHHHHELLQLFRAFNKDTSPQYEVSTSSKTHPTGAQLQRRHSFTSTIPSVIPLRSTTHQQHPRPQSFLETSASSLITGLQVSPTSARGRSKSQLNAPATTTTVPSLYSLHHETYSGSPQSLSTVSTYISVTSTDSPSPVECDGRPTKSLLEAATTSAGGWQKVYSDDQVSKVASDDKFPRFHSFPCTGALSKNGNGGSHPVLAPTSLQTSAFASEAAERLKQQQKTPTMLSHSHQLSTFLRSPRPYHHHDRPLSESVSHPEFPLMKPEMVVTERTASCGELYPRQRDARSGDFATSVSRYQRSPSPSSSPRQKIETLSRHMWDSLESVVGSFPHQFKNPFLDAFQRVFREVAPTYSITPEQYKSLVELNVLLCSRHSTPDPSLHTSLSQQDIAYRILEGPLEVQRQRSSPGCASLVFRVQLGDSRLQSGEVGILKAIVKVYDLVNPQEAGLYHAITDLPGASRSHSPTPCPSYSSTTPSFVQDTPSEVATLQSLPAHPHIQALQHWMKKNTQSIAHYARCLDNRDRPSAFAMHPTGHFLFFESHDKTLADVFSEHHQRHLSPSFDLSEEDVLTILAQLLLAIAHLNQHNVAHCAVHPRNILMDENSLILANFSHAFSLRPQTLEEIRGAVERLQRTGSCGEEDSDVLRLSPEAATILLSPDLDSACLTGQIYSLFEKSDSYAAGRSIYEFFLGPSLGQGCCTDDEIPYLESLTPRCNKLLRKMIAFEPSKRFSAIEAATCSLVLIFGPRASQVSCVEDCHRWIFSECMEFYMQPVLRGSEMDSGTSDVRSRLHYVYLTIADPQRIWDACQFFSSV